MKRNSTTEEHSGNENVQSMPKKMKLGWLNDYLKKARGEMKHQNNESLGENTTVPKNGDAASQCLGLKPDKSRCSAFKWNANNDALIMPEIFSWLVDMPNPHIPAAYILEDLLGFIRYGKHQITFSGETDFADPQIVQQLLQAKAALEELNEKELQSARTRSNPFETISSSVFLNCSAVKMANIDAMCDMMFTQPKDPQGNALVKADELLYFADICAGPGGFSEYILHRKSWEAKGFGFTLRGENDFKMDKFLAGAPESFDPFYGVKGDGDVYDEANQNSFADYIRQHTSKGVHFVMADGVLPVGGQENMREIHSKQLYLCQCLTALKILCDDGSFVCKLFDLLTPFSVGLIYLMYKCFKQIAILKPNSSRQANSERYLVCKWKRPDTTAICNYLNNINNILNTNKGGSDGNRNDFWDVLEIVGNDEMMKDAFFMNYIKVSNNQIGLNQIFDLRKIAAYSQNRMLREHRQSDTRKRCLELWGLPKDTRPNPKNKPTENLLAELLSHWSHDRAWLDAPAVAIKSTRHLQKRIKSPGDWYFVPIGLDERNISGRFLFLCRTRGELLRYEEVSKTWELVEGCVFEVTPNSLFFGEIVSEFSGEANTQSRYTALHIIDAICLGGIDIRRLSLCERMRICQKFALSVNKPFKKEHTSGAIRSKPLFQVQEIDDFFKQMRHFTFRDKQQRLGYALDHSSKYFVPGGIMMFCGLNQVFVSEVSRSSGKKYFFNTETGKSYYKNQLNAEALQKMYASFRSCYTRRLLWKWVNTQQVEEHPSKKDKRILHRSDFLRFLKEKQHPITPPV